MFTPPTTNPDVITEMWIDGEPGTPNDGKSRCGLCQDHIWFGKKNRGRHLKSKAHQVAVARETDKTTSEQYIGPMLRSVVQGVQQRAASRLRQYPISEQLDVDSGSESYQPNPPLSDPSEPTVAEDTSVYESLKSTLGGREERLTLDLPSTQAEILSIATGLKRMLDGEIHLDEESDEGECERSDDEVEPPLSDRFGQPEQPPSNINDWFPWSDKLSCTLDILMHLPRSAFSERQLDLLLWLLRMNGVNNLPSVRAMKNFQVSLQKLCGIGTIKYSGALGHTYYANDLGSLIGQEMSNPVVRKYLHFYPEDVGPKLEQAWHGRRWRHKLDPDLLTPMIRTGKGPSEKDFYIWEPTLLKDGRACMPIRWFMRRGAFYADAYRLELSGDRQGWVVRDWDRLIVSESELALSLPDFRASHLWRALPSPDAIQGIERQPGSTIEAWYRPSENRWRTLAKGHRVLSFMIWLYCDDTSGNVSKRWNKHNSFLFTAAGLPSDLVQHDFHVHFLSTSNIAPPLEMLGGIAEQVNKLQDQGTWVYDIEHKNLALVFPAILAMLGDNPMQSEFACHRGMMAKLFCRICKVSKGAGVADDDDEESGDEGYAAAVDDDASSVGSKQGGKGRKKVLETLEAMKDRVLRFLQIGERRSKQDTKNILNEIMDHSLRVGGKAAANREKTRHGVKDTFQDFFLDRLYAAQQGRRGTNAEACLDAAIAQLPEDTESPIWQLQGFDPHSDTPIEILHVVLLGFVKYFWRDAVSRLSTTQRATLQTRLSSFDVSGLNIPRLSGKTLVQYANSLTGRDFRAISQVAPFVLADLGLPEECLASWQALSALVPLVWQPAIANKEEYIGQLTAAIDRLLISTARWTPRWFNKPKFHLILHLPDHILDFGPAGIFATEAFESFNAIIRSKSVHSNRQAPSRDIARAFAQESRVRHLMSGGAFPVDISTVEGGYQHGEPTLSKHVAGADGTEPQDIKVVFRTPGRLALDLKHEPIVSSYIGFVNKPRLTHGLTNLNVKISHLPWEKTVAGRAGQPLPYPPNMVPSTLTFRTAADMTLRGGDTCTAGDWVLATTTAYGSSIGQVEEILRVKGSQNDIIDIADIVTLRLPSPVETSPDYYMPRFKKTKDSPLRVFSPEEITCLVNMQHHCLGNACDCSAREELYQEREHLLGQTQPKVKHRKPGDLVLNMAQMRNAAHIQPYRKVPAALDREVAVTEGCVKAIKAERARRAAASAAMEDSPTPDPGGPSNRALSPSIHGRESSLSLRLPRRLHELQNQVRGGGGESA